MKATNVNVGEETKSKSDRFSMTQQHPKTDRKKHEIQLKNDSWCAKKKQGAQIIQV